MLAVLVAASLQLSPDGAGSATMTREALGAELRRLDGSRPSLAAPIALLSTGAGVGLLGGYLTLQGATSLALKALLTEMQQTLALVALGVGTGFLVVGVTLAIIGTVLLFKRLDAAKQHRDAIEAVRKQLDAIDEAAPPPPPPSSLRRIPTDALVTLVTF